MLTFVQDFSYQVGVFGASWLSTKYNLGRHDAGIAFLTLLERPFQEAAPSTLNRLTAVRTFPSGGVFLILSTL